MRCQVETNSHLPSTPQRVTSASDLMTLVHDPLTMCSATPPTYRAAVTQQEYTNINTPPCKSFRPRDYNQLSRFPTSDKISHYSMSSDMATVLPADLHLDFPSVYNSASLESSTEDSTFFNSSDLFSNKNDLQSNNSLIDFLSNDIWSSTNDLFTSDMTQHSHLVYSPIRRAETHMVEPTTSVSHGGRLSSTSPFKFSSYGLMRCNNTTDSLQNSSWNETNPVDLVTELLTQESLEYKNSSPCLDLSNEKSYEDKNRKKEFKNINSSFVLVQPDEFKNPSSFLKVYGDPQCSRSGGGVVSVGKNGNWACWQCRNVNYPRRLRCNKCNEIRNASGDRIVADYVNTVYQQHLKSYRKYSSNRRSL